MSYVHQGYTEIVQDDGDTQTYAVGKWYMHGQSDEFLPLWSNEAEQQHVAHYLAYEIALDVRINMATGAGDITGIDGTPLAAPVKL